MKILITGIGGFIGFHLARKLMESGNHVQIVGLDNINDYYDPQLKFDRLKVLGFQREEAELWNQIQTKDNLSFYRANLEDRHHIEHIFNSHQFDVVINLAAQAGVRYSLENPDAYIQSNINGFFNILEGCRKHQIDRLLYASSSSVYGNNDAVPFSESDRVDHPVSLYAATKKSNELMAHTYAHLYGITCLGLRFFTVYGPWGRPDMAYYSFAKAISENKIIRVFNHGKLSRDFTYIDDIIDGIKKLIETDPERAYEIYNIGNNQPEQLGYFIETIEEALGKEAVKEYVNMQAGDVFKTFANIDKLKNQTGYQPKTQLKTGIRKFVEWYLEYHKSHNR